MTVLTGVKAVSFDVDGTLWDFESIMRDALARLIEEIERADPSSAGLLTVDGMVETRERVHDELMYKVVNLNEIRRESIRRSLAEIGRPNDGLAADLFDLYVKLRDAHRALFPDVEPALKELSARYTLGLLSNGNSYATRLGLSSLISFEVFSQDHSGIEKPDPRLFHIAVAEACCAPEELVHVGDNVEYDVRGARAAGIRSVWLNRNGDSPNSESTVDLTISTLDGFAGLLSA